MNNVALATTWKSKNKLYILFQLTYIFLSNIFIVLVLVLVNYTEQNYKRNILVFAPIFGLAIIMLSNQHLDMPHLWGGWIISAKEKCSLTQI